jgi:hypothetical protein
MITCPRCGAKTNTSVVSRFNTERICIPCEEAERKHPLYELAAKAEHHQCTLGNFNYEGIGCPKSLYKNGKQSEETKSQGGQRG